MSLAIQIEIIYLLIETHLYVMLPHLNTMDDRNIVIISDGGMESCMFSQRL